MMAAEAIIARLIDVVLRIHPSNLQRVKLKISHEDYWTLRMYFISLGLTFHGKIMGIPLVVKNQ